MGKRVAGGRGGSVGPGQGEYLKYSAQGVFNAAQGTVEVEVIRDKAKDEMESFFTLLDADEKTILAERSSGTAADGKPTWRSSTEQRLWYTSSTPSTTVRSTTPNSRCRPSAGDRRRTSCSPGGAREADCAIYVTGKGSTPRSTILATFVDDHQAGEVDRDRGAAAQETAPPHRRATASSPSSTSTTRRLNGALLSANPEAVPAVVGERAGDGLGDARRGAGGWFFGEAGCGRHGRR